MDGMFKKEKGTYCAIGGWWSYDIFEVKFPFVDFTPGIAVHWDFRKVYYYSTIQTNIKI
jgi:hypothetical protein